MGNIWGTFLSEESEEDIDNPVNKNSDTAMEAFHSEESEEDIDNPVNKNSGTAMEAFHSEESEEDIDNPVNENSDTAMEAFHSEKSEEDTDNPVNKNSDTAMEAFHPEESMEDIEMKMKRLYWSIKTKDYATNSMEHICSLFGLDEIDENFVMFLKGLSLSVFSQIDFVKIIKRLRHFIVVERKYESISRKLQLGEFVNLYIQYQTDDIEAILHVIDIDDISIKRMVQTFIDFDMNDLIHELEHHTSMTWKVQPSGSSQAGKVVCFGSDRDYLLLPTQVRCRIELSKEWPCYCRVFITNKQKLPPAFQNILVHENENELTSSKFKDYIFPAIDSFMEKARSNGLKIKRISNAETCPAYTIKGREFFYGHNEEYDLVPCLPMDDKDSSLFIKKIPLTDEELAECSIYVVLKPPNDDVSGLWRISFSSLEQKIIRDRFSQKEKSTLDDLKDSMKRMKRINEDKDDWTLSSYHITSFMLNEHGNFDESLDHYIYIRQTFRALINALKKKFIPHYFIPELNLLQDIDDEERTFFIREFGEYC